MKNCILPLLLFATVFSSSAQDSKHELAFKSYVTFIESNYPSGNTAYYGFTKFQIGGPAFALAITRRKGNYHQVELCDLRLNMNDQIEFPVGTGVTEFSVGFRYSYNISLLKSRNGKLKTFISPCAHVLINYNSVKFPYAYPKRYTTINGQLEIAPVVSYSFSPHFSVEANVPFTLIGFTEEISHDLDPSASDAWWRQDVPFLGAQYFQGRIGVIFNL